jgi:hypothetical protein
MAKSRWKEFNVAHHQGNANQSHAMSPHTCGDSYYQKQKTEDNQ